MHLINERHKYDILTIMNNVIVAELGELSLLPEEHSVL